MNSIVAANCPEHHCRTKREPGNPDVSLRIFVFNISNRSAQIVLLTSAIIVHALTLACAAKIEPEHRETGELESFRDSEHDFIVHSSAEQGVRMTHDGGASDRGRGFLQQSLDAACGPVKKHVTGQVGHGYASCEC